jgi:GAF domain-containing protein
MTFDNDDAEMKSLVAPIKLREVTLGSLQLHTSGDGREWNEDDLAVIEAVIDQMAQTAESLRLFNETHSRASREQTIRQITEKMRATNSLEELIRTTATELGRRLSAGHAVVEVGIEQKADHKDH